MPPPSGGADAGRCRRPRRRRDPEGVGGGRRRSHASLPPAGERARSARRPSARARHPGHGQVAGHEDKRHGDHRVWIRAHATEEAEVLDEDPVGQAEHAPRRGPPSEDLGLPVRNARPIAAEDDDDEQVDAPAVCRVEGPESAPTTRGIRLWGLGHLVDHPGQRPGSPLWGSSPARILAPARPGAAPSR